MRKLRNITIPLLLVCTLFWLSACSSLDSKYKPGHYDNQEIWICDEKDMWFICSIEPRLPPYGELTLDDEIIPIVFVTTTGARIYVRKSADPGANTQIEETLFDGAGRYREKKFKMTLYSDFFGDGTETLTFRLLDQDDENADAYLSIFGGTPLTAYVKHTSEVANVNPDSHSRLLWLTTKE